MQDNLSSAPTPTFRQSSKVIVTNTSKYYLSAAWKTNKWISQNKNFKIVIPQIKFWSKSKLIELFARSIISKY